MQQSAKRIGEVGLKRNSFFSEAEGGCQHVVMGLAEGGFEFKISPVIGKVTVVAFDSDVLPYRWADRETPLRGLIIKHGNGFQINRVGPAGIVSAPSVRFMYKSTIDEQAIDPFRIMKNIAAEIHNLRHIAGIFKRKGFGSQIPKGGLGISEMQSGQSFVFLPEGAAGIDRTVFKTKLEFAFFGIGSHQKIEGLMGREIAGI